MNTEEKTRIDAFKVRFAELIGCHPDDYYLNNFVNEIVKPLHEDLEASQKTCEEYRLKIPTVAQAMVYMGLLNKYEKLQADCAMKHEALRHFLTAVKESYAADWFPRSIALAEAAIKEDPGQELADLVRRLEADLVVKDAALPKADAQGISLGNTWISWDKLCGWNGEDEKERELFYQNSIIAKGVLQWREKLLNARTNHPGRKLFDDLRTAEDCVTGLEGNLAACEKDLKDSNEMLDWLSQCTAVEWEELNNIRLANPRGFLRQAIADLMKKNELPKGVTAVHC